MFIQAQCRITNRDLWEGHEQNGRFKLRKVFGPRRETGRGRGVERLSEIGEVVVDMPRLWLTLKEDKSTDHITYNSFKKFILNEIFL